ncbi:MAG: PIG-L family deacetylase [Pirellulales bacterium]|nr:PIG-L family deacetylase [Pirellulales bacterium]
MNTLITALESLWTSRRRAHQRRNRGSDRSASRWTSPRNLRLERLEDRTLLSTYPWDPQPEKAALMVVSAHPDDEGLFFSGVIPYYSTVADVPMVHISMTAGWPDGGSTETRQDELQDADWAYGLPNAPIFAGFGDVYTYTAEETFDFWNDEVWGNNDEAAGRLAAASYLATQIRIYQPDVIVTHDFEGEYGHGNHSATAYAVADAFELAADPDFVDGNDPWQTQKLYAHLYDHEPAEPMLSKLWMDWDIPYPELGGLTPLEVANAGLACHESQGGAELVTVWEGQRFSEQWGLYQSTVGLDTVLGDGWAHTDFFEHITTNDVPLRTGGTLTPVVTAEDDANATAVTLGFDGLSYSPGGGDESGQTLTYTITGISSSVLIFHADGTTPVFVYQTVTALELQGLTYKTVANAHGEGNLTWTVTDDGAPQQTLTENLPITVTSVNDAPVLNPTKSPALNAENEDVGAPSGAVGTLVSALVDFALPGGQVDNVSDVDDGAQLGIAVTAADTSHGSWWYSTNGGMAWHALGAVSNGSARLLSANAYTRIYFQPDPEYHGELAAAITFRAWDQTSGSNGILANTSSGGGASAFSSATDTAGLAVISQNDAPILDATKSPALGAVHENAGAPWGPVGTLASALVDFVLPAGQVDNVTDMDDGAQLGLAVTAADTRYGSWWYSTNNGINWNALGSVNKKSARLLAADALTRIYFQPDANYHGVLTEAITFRAWDRTSGVNGGLVNTSTGGGNSAFSSTTDTARLVVSEVNDIWVWKTGRWTPYSRRMIHPAAWWWIGQMNAGKTHDFPWGGWHHKHPSGWKPVVAFPAFHQDIDWLTDAKLWGGGWRM